MFPVTGRTARTGGLTPTPKPSILRAVESGFEAHVSSDRQIAVGSARGGRVRPAGCGDLRPGAARVLPAETDARSPFARCPFRRSTWVLPTRLLPPPDGFSMGTSNRLRCPRHACLLESAI